MFLTRKILQAKGACREQLDMFVRDFPDGTEVTAAVCRANPGYDYAWVARKLLPPEKRAAYRAARAPHLAAYQAAEAPLWAAYQAAEALHWAAYEAAVAEAFGRVCEEEP
jgi:hypothetical protein